MQTHKFKGKYNPNSNRFKSYDYSSNGGYFITICTKDRINYFGDIVDGKMILNELGKIAENFYNEIPKHFPFIILDEFIIMPNHIHGIIILNKNDTQTVETKDFLSLQGGLKHGTSKTLGSIVRGFKIGVTKWIRNNKNDLYQIWQSNYYDRIIRNEDELNRIRNYILENPLKWEYDKNNDENIFM